MRHAVNDRVAIKRHRHGWLDGAVSGKVTAVHPTPTGRVGYTVTGDDGNEYECRNTRDLRKESN
jgi:hypothetical protein